jgi:hypothetical protein
MYYNKDFKKRSHKIGADHIENNIEKFAIVEK